MRLRAPSPKQWRKAARLLRQRRVRLLGFGAYGCAAEVVGDGGTYAVTLFRGEWDCDCELREHRPSWACSHIAAVWLVWSAVREVETDGNKAREATIVRSD